MIVACIALLTPAPIAVEVPFRIGEDAIIADVEINGKKAALMFDTGFSGAVVLSDSLDIGKATGKVTLRDFVGSFEASTVKLSALKLGNFACDPSGLEAVKMPGDRYTESYGTHVDGVLGFEPMARGVFEINFQRKVFVFHPATTDISKRVPDGVNTFLVKLLPKGQNSIQLTAEAPGGQKLYLALDTGNAFYATTHKDVLERVGLWEDGRKPEHMGLSFVASGAVGSFKFKMPEIKIFTVPVTESVWSIIDRPSGSADHDGTVGFGFLKHFNITVDTSRRRLWLEKFSGRVSEPELAEIGMAATYDGQRKRMRIVAVTPGGPAEKSGIKRGDDLLSVDGKEIVAGSWRTMKELFDGELGSKVSLATSRNGELQRHVLERAVLVNLAKPPSE